MRRILQHARDVGEHAGPQLAVDQPVRSRWHQPADGADGWEQVRAHVLASRPAVVAVDNFHLPFRPAYQDVHTNHLLVVFGFDDEAEAVEVIDSVPPPGSSVISTLTSTSLESSSAAIASSRTTSTI